MSDLSLPYLVEIKNQVQLAHVPEILIQHLHKSLDQLQDNQLVFVFVHDRDKVEASISFIDDLVVFVVDKIAHFWLSGDH